MDPNDHLRLRFMAPKSAKVVSWPAITLWRVFWAPQSRKVEFPGLTHSPTVHYPGPPSWTRLFCLLIMAYGRDFWLSAITLGSVSEASINNKIEFLGPNNHLKYSFRGPQTPNVEFPESPNHLRSSFLGLINLLKLRFLGPYNRISWVSWIPMIT